MLCLFNREITETLSRPFTSMFFIKTCLFAIMAVCVNSSVVVTRSGPVRGQHVHENRLYYYAYRGIPYAEAPIGKLRFLPPVPKRPWTQVMDATMEGPICPQAEGQNIKSQMSENCLNLNVYVPQSKFKPLPVLAYIHGGEFKAQSCNADITYGPQFFLQQDIIVVTINYRLGALGFLSLGIEQASGNAGIKDVLMALQWINTNIEAFGGNKNKITLGGNSAGSVLAHYLMLTEKSSGLFQQILLISGSALGYRFLAKHPVGNALALAKELGLKADDNHTLLKMLKDVDVFDIVEAQEKIGHNNLRNGFRPFAPFVPCVEIESADAIITKEPIKIIQSGVPQNIPVLLGFNFQEGIKMIPAVTNNQKLLKYLNEDHELLVPSNIEYPIGSAESKELGNSIKQFYFGDNDISNKTLQNFVNLITDTQFSYGIESWIKIHMQREDCKDVYYYIFDFDGDLNWFKLSNNVAFPGTSHADELGYIFLTQVTKPILCKADERSMKMSNTIVSLFSNYVKSGNPTPGDNDSFKWPSSNQQWHHFLLNENPTAVATEPFTERLQYWRNVYDRYNNYVEQGGPLEDKIVP